MFLALFLILLKPERAKLEIRSEIKIIYTALKNKIKQKFCNKAGSHTDHQVIEDIPILLMGLDSAVSEE